MDEVMAVAKGLLLDFKNLPGFASAKVSATHPIYDVSKVDSVAYYEVKFSSPEKENNGYAIISATTEDYPVVEFSEKGTTHYERFEKLTDGREFRLVRFGPQYIVAEDNEGRLLAEIGFRPIRIPKQLRKHMRRESKADSGPVKFPEIPEVDKKTLRTLITMRQLPDYKAYKREFRKPALKPKRVKGAWVRALKPRSNPGCVYEIFWADGFFNHPYYLQIPKNTPPNNNDHASGCGPTAWMNLFGWHDLNWTPNLLSGSRTYNDNYVESMTMELHDYLGTFEPWFTFGADQGFTWPDDMEKGINYARKKLHYDCSHWCRHDWWYTDEEWVFEVARKVARAKRPFIVGYYQDWHYAIGYGIAECKSHGWKQHSWLRIYPAWSTSDSNNKWIPMDTIFGVYGVYNFVPLLEFVKIENPQELRVYVNGPGDANRLYIYSGTAVFKSRGGIGSDWLKDEISFEVGRSFSSNQFRKVTATASLASIANNDKAYNAGWAVDRVEATRSPVSGKMRLNVKFAIRDIDGYLYRIAYKVNVLARILQWETWGSPPLP